LVIIGLLSTLSAQQIKLGIFLRSLAKKEINVEFNKLEFGFMSRILATYVIADYNMLNVDSNCTEVDVLNQGDSPVAVTENLWECTYALQRLRPIYRAIGWVQHWADKYALVGERYYAIIS
jgi:hypothetical protein